MAKDNNILSALEQAVQSFLQGSTYTDMPQGTKAKAPIAPATSNQQPQQTGGVMLNGFAGRPPISLEVLKANIAKTYPNAPILNYLDKLIQAGNQMPSHIDPALPIVMSLRETQGGADLNNPAKNGHLGLNNIFNITGTQPGNTKPFVNYPDVNTAIMGGPNNGVQSGGFVGLINHTIPSQSDNYAQFRQTGNLGDLFNHYSPPGQGNGPLTLGQGDDKNAQVPNYNYIRSKVTGDDESPYNSMGIPQFGSGGIASANFNQ